MASHTAHRSLPTRSPSHRPRALSLSEYQPLAFDRDAIQAAYQTQLFSPSVSSAGGHGSNHGTGSGSATGTYSYSSDTSGAHGLAGRGMTNTNSSTTVPTKGSGSGTDSSSGGHPGGNGKMGETVNGAVNGNDDGPLQAPVPVWAADERSARRASGGNMTGIGAGHSLTPPDSPLHRAAQVAGGRARTSSFSLDGPDSSQGHALSPIPASPAVYAPGNAFIYPSHPPPPLHQSTIEASSPGVGGVERQLGRMGVDEAFDVPSPTPAQGALGNGMAGMDGDYPYNPISSDGQLVPAPYAQNAAPDPYAPPLPARPPISGAGTGTGIFNSRAGKGKARTGPSGQAEDDGWDSDPGFPRYVGQYRDERRALPAVPANVPAPAPPAWEPDYKPQIPTTLTQPSVDHAYAQLSAPPPGVHPRIRPNANQYASSSTIPPPSSQPHNTAPLPTPLSIPSSSSTQPQPQIPMAGAPDFPPTSTPPQSPIQIATQRPPRPKLPRPAEDRIHLRADGRTPIWSTHYLDPSLRNTVVSVPAQLSNLTNVALSGIAGGEKTGWNSTTGAPMDGMARLAKEWFLTPDGRFTGDKGPIELGVGVVDAGETGWGREKGRKRARVEVINKAGGIKVDLIEVDEDRQVDLRVEAKAGDILVLLPEDFFGTIHVSSPNAPHFCRLLSYNKAQTARPTETFFSTFIVPPDIAILAAAYGSVTESNPSTAQLSAKERKARAAKPIEHRATLGGSKIMPDFLKAQDPMIDQVVAAYAAHTRGEWSKVHVTNMGAKGRVVFGYRETGDEVEVNEMGLRVGVQHEKRKRWWSRS